MLVVKEIEKIRRRSNGIQTKIARAHIKTRENSSREQPIEYLASKKVYPYFVDWSESTIYFIETRGEIDHNASAFFYDGLQSDAKYLIRANLAEALEFMNRHEFDDSRLLFIHHPGRSGSTLLHRLLGSHPAIQSVSEDLIFENVLSASHPDASERALRSIVAFIASKLTGESHRLMAFKMAGHAHLYFDALARIFPGAKHIYITNDAVKICESLLNVLQRLFIVRILTRLRFYRWKAVPYSRWKALLLFEDPYFSRRKTNNGSRFRISYAECLVLSVLIKDQFFSSQGSSNVVYLQYKDILTKDALAGALNSFLGFDFAGGIDVAVYHEHSQKGIGDHAVFGYRKLTQNERAQLEAFKVRMSELTA